MPKAMKQPVCVTNTNELQENSNPLQDSSSEDDEVVIQSPQFQPSTSQTQPVVQPMYMPYIVGPRMDWTVNDSLFHRFLK